MRHFIQGAVFVLVLLALAGGAFLFGGGMPVATRGGPLPMELFIASTVVNAAMRGQTDQPSPIAADETQLLAGAKTYVTNCSPCHGRPEQKKTAIAKGMFPPPPQLMPPNDGVTDDPVGEIFWKVKNGIRLTGMPGFTDSLSETEMWQVSELLLNANKLSPSVLAELR